MRDLGNLPEALADYNEAVAIRNRLVNREGRLELSNDLAQSLNNRGVVLGVTRQGRRSRDGLQRGRCHLRPAGQSGAPA